MKCWRFLGKFLLLFSNDRVTWSVKVGGERFSLPSFLSEYCTAQTWNPDAFLRDLWFILQMTVSWNLPWGRLAVNGWVFWASLLRVKLWGMTVHSSFHVELRIRRESSDAHIIRVRSSEIKMRWLRKFHCFLALKDRLEPYSYAGLSFLLRRGNPWTWQYMRLRCVTLLT